MTDLSNIINKQFNLFDRGTDILEKIVNDYPASSLARLILLRKYKETDNPLFQKLRSDSALYMDNIPWYLFVLSQAGEPEIAEDEKEQHILAERPSPPTVLQTAESTPVEEMEEKALHSVVEIAEGKDTWNEPETQYVEELNPENENVGESFISDLDNSDTSEIAHGAQDTEVLSDTTFEEPEIEEVQSLPVEEPPVQSGQESITVPPEALSVVDEKTEDVQSQEPVTNETAIVEQDLDIEEIQSPHVEDSPSQNGQESITVPPEALSIVDEKTEDGQSQDPVTNETVIVEQDPEMEVPESPENVEFEPLYTIDYFASQGIKLNEEDLKDDKLFQQVKSFTGWLKSMKKLHPGRLPEQNEVIERIIQNASERSNVEADVLTEAMAEVLVKQNKKEKAIKMYEKLSLMNPSKSAYFAAKIENLKTT